MRSNPTPNSFHLVVASLLLALSAQWSARAQSLNPQPEKPVSTKDFDFNYTGALFGYYQINENEKMIPAVQRFITFRPGEWDKPNEDFPQYSYLLVGMGDNFAPEFRASLQPDEPNCNFLPDTAEAGAKQKNEVPQRFYKSSLRILKPESVPCDNVARFLISAGYRAIVPGREDFIYSAPWLREMAIGLRREGLPINNPDRHLNMLAANLRIKSPKGCPLLFSGQDNTQIVDITCTSGDVPVTTEMDWLRRLEASLKSPSEFESQINSETSLQAKSKQHCNPDTLSNSENCFDPVHQSSALQLRRVLIENQAMQVRNMIDGLEGWYSGGRKRPLNHLAAALEQLAKDDRYILNEHDVSPIFPGSPRGGSADLRKSGLYLNPVDPPASPAQPASGKTDAEDHLPSNLSGIHALAAAKEALSQLGADCAPASEAPHCDLIRVTDQLIDFFEQIDSRQSLLFDLPVRLAGRRMLLRAIANEQKEVGYTISQKCALSTACKGSERTLIVGVISQKVMNAVSSINLKLKAARKPQAEKSAGSDAKGGPEKDEVVETMDPLPSILAVLRGARRQALDNPDEPTLQFDRVILLAQMDRSEAVELGARLHSILIARHAVSNANSTGDGAGQKALPDPSDFDLTQTPLVIVTKADASAYTPSMHTDFDLGSVIPVLTPKPTYGPDGSLQFPISLAEVATDIPDLDHKVIKHTEWLVNTPPPDPEITDSCESTLTLLLAKVPNSDVPNSCAPIRINGDSAIRYCKSPLVNDKGSEDCERDLTTMLLKALRKSEGDDDGDVVLLEQRDIFYGWLPKRYTDYEICNKDEGCELRVALDRVLWKGDSPESVMISGSDLVSMLSTSRKEAQDEESLTGTGAFGESLATYGIVQPLSTNLSNPGTANNRFPLAQDNLCGAVKDPVTNPSQYCVNGQPISSDGAYWTITSDHLANDSILYKAMHDSVALGYHRDGKNDYITEAIASVLLPPKQPAAAGQTFMGSRFQSADSDEWQQQLQPILHIDISKLVAGISARRPSGGNLNAENFQGATDARASTPAQQELDLESLSRFSFDLPTLPCCNLFKGQQLAWSLGVQPDAEYDRAATGNLANKPPTVVYALNSLTVTPFLQIRIPQWRGPRGNWKLNGARELSRYLLVLTPIQPQRQIVGTSLAFPFTLPPPPTTPPTIAGQFTLQAPVASSYFTKVGLRGEFDKSKFFIFDKGSYAEGGFESGSLHNILDSVSLSTGNGTVFTCTANSTTTIPACFAGYAKTSGFQVNAETKSVSVLSESAHSVGAYWDVHLQKQLLKPQPGSDGASATSKPGSKTGINFSLDSKADWFSPRGQLHALNTQTQYAIPLSASLNFPVLRNFSLSPTLSSFFYATQVTRQSINIETFSITAKWYFARDETVPPHRQLLFAGPASADQTSTARIK
jgi:hypothetical protein